MLLINKIDLLKTPSQVDFDIKRVKTDARKLNKGIEVFPLSAKVGEGMNNWYDWLTSTLKGITRL